MTLSRRGFTLVELLVVVAMIGVLLAALSSSVSGAMQRAKIQKATGDVKIITQAILGYENYARGGDHELPTMARADANAGSLGFLVGDGGSADSGGNIPVLLMAAFRSGGNIVDPWGTPYKVTIRGADADVRIVSASSSMQTLFQFPNFYRLSPEERE